MTGPVAQAGSDLLAFVRFARGLRPYLEARLDHEEARGRIAERLDRREDHLVRLLEERVFPVRRSPYRALFEHAGIEPADAVRLVREEGVEGALGRFYDAGVYVALDELKGRRPLRRGSLELAVASEDFDNPGLRHVLVGSTSGSRGPARRTRIDFRHLEDNAVYVPLSLHVHGLAGRPYAIWRPVPPGQAGLGSALSHAKAGKATDRWFSQYPLVLTPKRAREYAFTRVALRASRRAGVPIPRPEHVPLDRADVVARWLAEQAARGTPALLTVPGSSGVRVCLAAERAGLDISGTVFRFGGEPLTESKARTVAAAGGTVYCNYSMSEAGRVGLGCPRAAELDEVHLATDKLGVIQRERDVGGARVGALLYTTLLPSAAKVLLNFESDDYGVLSSRDCGCPLEQLGLRLHLHGIRSYDKLTSEGMNFVGSDLLALVEEVLPARFGGGPADYQLLEEEVDGLPKVSVVVSPRVGEVDDAAVVRAVLESLGSGPAYRGMMASLWRTGDTLRVVRREPYATSTAKILALHVDRR